MVSAHCASSDTMPNVAVMSTEFAFKFEALFVGYNSGYKSQVSRDITAAASNTGPRS